MNASNDDNDNVMEVDNMDMDTVDVLPSALTNNQYKCAYEILSLVPDDSFQKVVDSLKGIIPLTDDKVASIKRHITNEKNNYGTGGPGLRLFHEEEGLPNLYSLYKGDLGEKVLSYASVSDLCKIDTLSNQFQGLTEPNWEQITNERFGMKNGKDGWKLGTSLLRKPVFIHINKAPNHDSMFYAGSPKITAHNSTIAVTSDDATDDGAPDGVCVYDALSLSFIGERGEGGWNVTIAGPAGAEIFVTNYSHRLKFSRGDVSQIHLFPHNRSAGGIASIGCDTHFIAVAGNTMNLYKVTQANALLILCQSVVLGRRCEIGGDEHYSNLITWGSDESHCLIYHSLDNYNDTISGTCEISVWLFDAESDNLSQTQTIEAGIDLKAVALADNFIVGASVDKKIHVWDRHTKAKKSYVLCDAKAEDQLDNVHIIYPLCMSFHGHMLVTTSHVGSALCVWNIKTGQLLKRYNDAEKEGYVDMLTAGCDNVTSMAYVQPLNGFVCTDGFLEIWTFPTNQNQNDMALSIQRREQDLRRNAGERP